MLLSGANFSLHFIAWRSLSLKPYQRDSEFRLYGLLIVLLTIVALLYLYFMHVYGSFSESYYHAMFQVVSIATTTGFTTTDYSHWPGFLPVLLVLASFAGGCAGSTGGGMKVIRVLLLFKQGWREVLRLIHPNARIAIKLNKKPVDRSVIQAVWGFFSVYIAIFVLFMLILMAAGMDQVTAFSAVAATLNNLGPGLGSKVTGKKQKWDEAYQHADYSSAEAAAFTGGFALDLACGRAGNAQFLSKQNFEVDAVDISSVVLEGLATYSKSNHLKINTILRDVENEGMLEKELRELFPQILNSLKPGGLLFYQTWSQLKVSDAGPSNPNFLLSPGELLKLCAGLNVLFYRENGKIGNTEKGLRNEAQIIVQKPI
ncbi:Trk system potassium uptake protein TrkH [Nymphon striatum]|nr:Trk system potassium uptake protein TrkH [Nymphon striatum]